MNKRITVNRKRLTWNLIKESFKGQWVELVECEWDWEKPFPSWAVVRNHAPDRAELMSKIGTSGNVSDAIVLYLGFSDSLVPVDRQATTL